MIDRKTGISTACGDFQTGNLRTDPQAPTITSTPANSSARALP